MRLELPIACVFPSCFSSQGFALLLAVIGTYGVMSYVVTLRTQEWGWRGFRA